MEARRLPNGKLSVPLRAEGPGGVIGDGWGEIGPEHPMYEKWDAWLKSKEALEKSR